MKVVLVDGWGKPVCNNAVNEILGTEFKLGYVREPSSSNLERDSYLHEFNFPQPE